MLRNPIERAYSHYQYEVKRGNEQRTFSDAIDIEEERLYGEEEKMLSKKRYFSFNHSVFSYKKRGIYINQVKRWRSFFPEQQILVVQSERFYQNPQEIMNKVFRYLEIDPIEFKGFKKYNANTYPEIGNDLRMKLAVYFENHNRELYKYLKCDFGWQ